jgi:hypothetical protein
LDDRILTPRERIAVGKSQRNRMRRTDHTGWNPKARTADPLELLRDSMRGRIPALVDVKYEHMVASAFGFFRGAVPVNGCRSRAWRQSSRSSAEMHFGAEIQLCPFGEPERKSDFSRHGS